MGLSRSVGRLCSQAFPAQGASEAENLNLKRSHFGSGAPQKFNAKWPHQEAAWTIVCLRQAIQSPSLPSVVCVLKHSLHKGLARSSWEFEPEEKPLWIRSPSKIQRLLTPSRSGLNNCCVRCDKPFKVLHYRGKNRRWGRVWNGDVISLLWWVKSALAPHASTSFESRSPLC